jgi:hypothetical protein
MDQKKKIMNLYLILLLGYIIVIVKSFNPLSSQPPQPSQGYHQLLEVLIDSDLNTIEKNYDKYNIEFLNVLEHRLTTEKSDNTKLKLKNVHTTVKEIMQQRMIKAAEKFQELVMSSQIQEKINSMVKNKELDEPILLLMKSNLQQAEKAGSKNAIRFFKNLIQWTQDCLDENLIPSKLLLRRLIREENKEKRKDILYEAFRTKKPMLLADGSKTSPMPEVKPPEFIGELETLQKNFGNIPEIKSKVIAFTEEAEEVATSIYGESMTTKQQQEYMWNKRSISVFDLEKLELDAEKTGKQMPWESKTSQVVDTASQRLII